MNRNIMMKYVEGDELSSDKVNIEELVKQRPILTEEDMNSFMTYEEIIDEAKRLFDEAVMKIWQDYDNKSMGAWRRENMKV